MLSSFLLKSELAKSVEGLNERRDEKEKQKQLRSTNPTATLVYDIQGHYIKKVWKKVFAEETYQGRILWTDILELIEQCREQRVSEQGNEFPKVDFALGPGGCRAEAVVSRFDKKYQRYYGNKRRQYHQLHRVNNPPLLPETHFSIHSAIRSVEIDEVSNGDDIWFIKAPGVQRGEGIIVKEGSKLKCVRDSEDCGNGAHTIESGVATIKAKLENEDREVQRRLKSNKQWRKHVLQKSPAQGNIACIDGRKADLRMYILHAPDGNIYYFPNAVVRIAQIEYRGSQNISHSSQLTNVSTGGHIIQGADWELFRQSLPSIANLLKRLVLYSSDWFQRGRCELIGVDIILDAEGTPYLLELNNSPQMGGHDTPYLFRIEMLKQMLHLAVYPTLRSYYCSSNDILDQPVIPPRMPQDQIQWVLLQELSLSDLHLPAFPIRFAWLVDELVYFEKIFAYLSKEEGRGMDSTEKHGLAQYIQLLAEFKDKTYAAFENNHNFAKPSVKFDTLGCVGIIIHPSLPNEEVVCIGYKGKCWLLKKKIDVFNSIVLSHDGTARKLEKIQIETALSAFMQS